jgi:ribose transport system permease protein
MPDQSCNKGIKLKKNMFSQQVVVIIIGLLMIVGFSVFLPGFRTTLNMVALLQNVAILGILSLGMAVVVISRGIDLSMVALLVVPSGLLLQLVQNGYSVPVALFAALALALIFGLVNGFLIAYVEISPLFTTLGTGIFLAGMGQAVFFPLDVVQWVPALNSLEWIGSGAILTIPKPIIMFGLIAGAITLFLRKTRLGLYVYAIGDNPTGARTTGISTRPMIVMIYVLAAMVATYAGLVMSASILSMPTRIYNSTMIYDVILIVIIGGIGMTGGRGRVSNVIVGTLLIGILLNGMTILDVSYSAQNMVKGVVLLAALLFDTFLNPRNEDTAQQGDV